MDVTVCCMFWRLFVASVLMKLNLGNSKEIGKSVFLCILKLSLGRRQWHRQPKDAHIINASRHLFCVHHSMQENKQLDYATWFFFFSIYFFTCLTVTTTSPNDPSEKQGFLKILFIHTLPVSVFYSHIDNT